MKNSLWIFVAFLNGLFCFETAQAQTPTFNISPSVITNNYVGPITLTIGNLPVGQKVIIGEFLDANGNGTIDAGEYESRHFGVVDGVQSIIGGATNINVPGDTDGAANGQITVVLNYPGINGIVSAIAGNYLFRLSDTNNVLAPVTNSFMIKQQSAAQGVSGTVYANGAPLANAVVVLASQHGNAGGGTVADASGNFSISNAPGTYMLIASAPGYVGQPAQVNISSNSFLSVNLTNVTATGYLSGTISDSSTGKGLPGLFVTAQANSELTLGFTDTNGSFALPAVAEQWKIKIDSSSGLASTPPFGYVAFQNNKIITNLTSGSISNLNFSFPRATALIYGQFTDSHSNAIGGAFIDAISADNLYEGDGATTATGQYAIGVFSNAWSVGPQDLSGNYIATTTNIGVVNGAATNVNLQAQLVTAYLSGVVVDDSGIPQGNIGFAVNSLTTNGFLTQLNQNFSTAPDGTFSIGLYGGMWNLAPECSQASQNGLVPPNINFTLVDGVNQSNIVMVERRATCTISGSVFDKNGNPVDAIAYASANIDGTNYSPCASSSSQGTNTFQIAVFPGNWSVGLSGDFVSGGFDNPGNQNVNVTAGTATVNFVLYPAGQTPPQLSYPGHNPGGFSFTVMGDPQQKYAVQVSTNLTSWQSLVTNTAVGGSFFFQDTNAAGPRRFYRAVLVP